MPDVVMPRLSDSMEEGTVLRWLKEEGDSVRRGDALVEIETDKATMTYEADADGVLEILAGVGDTLPIGEPIARIGERSSVGAALRTPAAAGPAVGEAPPADPSVDGAPTTTPFVHEAHPPADAPVNEGPPSDPPLDGERAPADGERAPADGARVGKSPAPVNGARVRASPLAWRIAREQGVELAGLSGSGPGGRVIRADVEAAVQGAQRAPAIEPHTEGDPPDGPSGPPARDGRATPDPATHGAPPALATQPARPTPATDGSTGRGELTIVEPTRAQQVVARRMAESRATIPDFTLRSEVDMEECVNLRAQLAELRPAADALPTYNDMIVRACAVALREHPRANAGYRDGRFELHGRVNVGIAVAAQDALVVPTVFDADRKSLMAIARDTRGLAGRVREGVITPPELSGGTFTVSNLGMYGVSSFTAVINPPQAAIMSVGSVAARAVVRDGVLVARHTADLTLACDHRILYGADAARFLARVRELLVAPLALVF